MSTVESKILETKNLFWGFVDEDCPIIVLNWLSKAYDTSYTVEDINKCLGTIDKNSFINPFYKFKNQQILDIAYDWCMKAMSSPIDPKVIYSETGPMDNNPYVYFPALIYFIGVNQGVKFNKLISDIDLLYHIVSSFKKKKDIIKIDVKEFDPTIQLEQYKRENLEKFLISFGYSRTDVKKMEPKVLYDKLNEIYSNDIFKFEGCICIYKPRNNDPLCFTESEFVVMLKELKLNDDQLRQLFYICKRHRLRNLENEILNASASSKIVAREYLNVFLRGLDQISRMRILSNIKKSSKFLESITDNETSKVAYEVCDYFNKLPVDIQYLRIVIDHIVSKETIGDLLRGLSEGKLSNLLNLISTLKCYSEMHDQS